MTKMTPEKQNERDEFVKKQVKVIAALNDYLTLTEIAQLVEKQYNTVQRWSKGRGKCSRGDYELMKKEVDGRNGFDIFEGRPEGGEDVQAK